MLDRPDSVGLNQALAYRSVLRPVVVVMVMVVMVVEWKRTPSVVPGGCRLHWMWWSWGLLPAPQYELLLLSIVQWSQNRRCLFVDHFHYSMLQEIPMFRN